MSHIQKTKLTITSLSIAILFSSLPYRALGAENSSDSSDSAKPSITVGLVEGLTGARTDSSIQQSGINSGRKWGMGASVMLDTPIDKALSVGIGAIYIKRKFDIGNNTLSIERSIPTLFVPLEAKLWLGNFFDVGLGGFGSIRVGDEQNSVISGGNTGASISTGQRSTLEFGMTASLAFTFPIQDRTGITIGGRYLRGFTNSSDNSIYNEKIDDVLLTAGLRISL